MTGIANESAERLRPQSRSSGTALIGSTGFVGGNLSRQLETDHRYHSTNIDEIDGLKFDLLICAGVRAVKWWANQHPDEDKASIDNLLSHLTRVESRETIVISTVDVYPHPVGVDETTPIHSLSNHAYGAHRLFFEECVKRLFSKVRIVRLPALFGHGLKKNVIYDLIHDNNLAGVHPDSTFQYYDVSRLWHHLDLIRRADLDLVNLATEPVSTERIRARYFPSRQLGGSRAVPAAYDMRSRYSAALGGRGYYIESAEQVLTRLGDYLVERQGRE